MIIPIVLHLNLQISMDLLGRVMQARGVTSFNGGQTVVFENYEYNWQEDSFQCSRKTRETCAAKLVMEAGAVEPSVFPEHMCGEAIPFFADLKTLKGTVIRIALTSNRSGIDI